MKTALLKLRGFGWRHAALLLTVVGSLVIVLSLARIGQDPDYHRFADLRAWLGINNFLNVLSNLPFLLVGVAGARYCLKQRALALRSAWLTFFIGVALVSAGSAWYHWQPNSASLVWDRLPMTIAFMGLLVALLAESMQVQIGKWLLVPAVLTGLASVLYWQQSDDLRFYVWVQAVPLLTIPVVMPLYRRRYTHHWLLLVALGSYLVAKLFEFADRGTFAVTNGLVSGHALKHLFAALACYLVLAMLKTRKPVGTGGME
jgi:hypothetical protein